MPGAKKVSMITHCHGDDITNHNSSIMQIKYAGSEAHITELLEKVCDNANDYATSTDDNG